jgi:hypothetical protein
MLQEFSAIAEIPYISAATKPYSFQQRALGSVVAYTQSMSLTAEQE